MINLIPPEGHTAVKQEYLLRVGAVFGFLFTGVMVLLAVSFIPTYVLVKGQIDSSVAEAHKETEGENLLKDAAEDIRKTKEVLTQLKSISSTSTLPSMVIAEVLRTAPGTISFKNFTVDAPGGKMGTFNVQGVALTRESLADLRKALEASPLFSKAEVPISDLARDADLPFVITITLEQK